LALSLPPLGNTSKAVFKTIYQVLKNHYKIPMILQLTKMP